MIRFAPVVLVRSSLVALGCLLALAGCFEDPGTDTPPGDDDDPSGRWASATTVDDLVFATGRDVVLDEIFELGEDGSMRGDFAGWDPVTRCVVTYRLDGSWALLGDDSLDAQWSSIHVTVEGCQDDADNSPDTDVTAEEGELWDDELDGVWHIEGDRLTLGESIEYTRVETPFVARWVGTSVVTDFEFSEGEEVLVDEVFWMNQDGSLEGYFVGTDELSGCTVDYRMTGEWSLSGELLDAEWTSISGEVWGCDDELLDTPPEELVAEEGEIWNDELDGVWTVLGDTLTIEQEEGSLEYQRAL